MYTVHDDMLGQCIGNTFEYRNTHRETDIYSDLFCKTHKLIWKQAHFVFSLTHRGSRSCPWNLFLQYI